LRDVLEKIAELNNSEEYSDASTVEDDHSSEVSFEDL
jgi:hypothetical protein